MLTDTVSLLSSKNNHFSVLLITDMPETILPDLELAFQKIYISNNDKEALNIFLDNHIDLVFLDIDTVDVHWLDIVLKFREHLYDIPISIIISAEDKNQLTTVISMGFNQCLLKPIDPSRIKFVINDMINNLQHKKDAQELSYLKQKEIAAASALNIIQGIPAPIFVFKGSDILFSNKSLHSLFRNKHLPVKEKMTLLDIETLFENMTSLNQFSHIKEGKSLTIHYHYRDATLKKVFVPTKFPISLEIEDPCFVIVLSDIAPHLMQIKMMEYQKQKVVSYKEVVEELLARRVFHESSHAITSPARNNFKENTYDQTLSDYELQLLRKSIPIKITAKEYVENLDVTAYDDIHELATLTDDLFTNIELFLQEPSKETIVKVAQLFAIHGNIVKSLIEFVDLGNAIYSLNEYICSLDEEEIRSNAKTIHTLFINLLEDLVQWRINIFETQVVIDIHYLDSSIFSSILQLQLNISKDYDFSDDFELF